MGIQRNKLEKILRGSREVTGKFFHALKTLVFPVEILGLSYNSDKKEHYLTSQWSRFNEVTSEERRNIIKSFNNRRKVDVGETYTSKLKRYHGWGGGSRMSEYDAKRIDKNTILLNGYVVSTDNKQLLEYAKKGFLPIKYNWVIF